MKKNFRLEKNDPNLENARRRPSQKINTERRWSFRDENSILFEKFHRQLQDPAKDEISGATDAEKGSGPVVSKSMAFFSGELSN